MALSQNTLLGQGGIGMHGTDERSAATAIKELQSLRVAVVAGGAANAKLAVADIRTRDTILTALNNNAGVITDVTGTVSIVDLRATGTVTVGAETAADTVTIAGRTFTLVAGTATVDANDYTKVKIGASPTATATNLTAAVNSWALTQNTPPVSATSAAAVVTITALADGTGGNDITLAEVGATFTVSGATLSGGSAAGGIKSSGVTNSVILFWYDKPA